MPGQNVTITMTADDRDVIKSWQKQQAEILKNQKALMRMGQAGGRAGKSTAAGAREATSEINRGKRAVGEFVEAIGGIGAVIGAVVTAVQAIRQEHQRIVAMQEEARIAGTSFAEQIRKTRLAFIPDKTVKDKELEQEIIDIAEETRTSPKLVAAAATDALSAKGQLPNEVALEAVAQGFRLAPGDLGTARELSGRALDIMKTTDIRDPREALGFLQNVQSASRVTSLEKVGAAGVPAITGMQRMGDSAEEAAELFATFTQLMADANGELSKTASINLSKKLGAFVPERQAQDERGKFTVPQAQIEAFEAAEDTQERLQVMRESPELRRAFLGETSFEAGATGAVRALLEGQKTAMDELQRARKAIEPPGPGQRQLFEQKVAQLEGGEFAPLRAAEDRRQVNAEITDLMKTEEQRIAEARKTLQETFADINLFGPDFIARKHAMAQFEAKVAAGVDPERAAMQELERLKEGQAFGMIDALDRKEENLINKNIDSLRDLRSSRREPPEEPNAVGKLLTSPANAPVTSFMGEDGAATANGLLQRQVEASQEMIDKLEAIERRLEENNREQKRRARNANVAGARAAHGE